MPLSSTDERVHKCPNDKSWEERKMTGKTIRRQSVSRRTMLSGTAGLLGGAALSSGAALSQNTAPASPAAAGNSPASPRYPDPAWLALRQEEIIEPGLGIVDPPPHLWGRPGK